MNKTIKMLKLKENPQDAFRFAVACEERRSQGRSTERDETTFAENKNPCADCRLELTPNQLAAIS